MNRREQMCNVDYEIHIINYISLRLATLCVVSYLCLPYMRIVLKDIINDIESCLRISQFLLKKITLKLIKNKARSVESV